MTNVKELLKLFNFTITSNGSNSFIMGNVALFVNLQGYKTEFVYFNRVTKKIDKRETLWNDEVGSKLCELLAP